MPLTMHHGTPIVDLEQRFKEESRHLPQAIRLEGNEMLVAIATELLRRYAPRTTITEDGARVTLLSMEGFGTAFLAAFLEDKDPPKPPLLLHTIPEALLIEYAQRHSIPIIQPTRDDVRSMLDRIAAQQPQTYFSLCRSAERLLERAQTLRDQGDKAVKGD